MEADLEKRIETKFWKSSGEALGNDDRTGHSSIVSGT